MTTSTLTEPAMRIRCTFRPQARLSLGDLDGNVSGLSSLLCLLAFIESYDQGGRFLGYYRKSLESPTASSSADVSEVLSDADRWDAVRGEIANQVSIKSLSYQSPLDIVLMVSGGFGLAVMSAQRLLTLMNQYHGARAVQARTNAEIAAHDAEIAAYNRLRLEIEESKTPDSARLFLASGAFNMAAAARAMAALESVEVSALEAGDG